VVRAFGGQPAQYEPVEEPVHLRKG
jgi:hypothetical protein